MKLIIGATSKNTNSSINIIMIRKRAMIEFCFKVTNKTYNTTLLFNLEIIPDIYHF